MKQRETIRFSALLGPSLILVSLLTYGRYIFTGFASEDFLILSYLHQGPLISRLAEQFSSPWLGLSYVQFYRPVATLLLGMEYMAFGLKPFGYHLAHVLLHGLNGVLVFSILRRLHPARCRKLSALAATLFVVYPMHHGAILFTGGFATLFGAFFLLLSLWLYLGAEKCSSSGKTLGSLAAFAAALGSYEAAVVLPLILHSLELAPRGTRGQKSLFLRARRILPFWGLLGVYMLLRQHILGVFVGGYAAFQERPLARLGRMSEDLLLSLPRLLEPNFQWLPSREILFALALGLLVAGGAFFGFAARRSTAPEPRLWGLALVWAALFQLPFFFVATIPATGRFWYLASLGPCLGIATLSRTLSTAGASHRPTGVLLRAAGWLLAATALGHYGWLLNGDLRYYEEADRQVRGVQAAVEQLRDGPGKPRPLLLAGVPDFVRNHRGLAVAKVLQYGLYEAARPPFGSVRAEIFPLPPTVSPDRFAALARAAEGEVYRWLPKPMRFAPTTRGPKLAETPLRPRLLSATLEGESRIRFSGCPCPGLRLMVVTSGGTYAPQPRPEKSRSGTIDLPMDFIASMANLYQGTAYWWLEDRKGRRLMAVSAIGRLEQQRPGQTTPMTETIALEPDS